VQNGAEVEVVRNDKLNLEEVSKKYEGIIISPGPGTPKSAGCTMQLLERYYAIKPIFGVCLGMQAIGEYFGASLEKASYPMHGKVSNIKINEESLMFQGIQSPMAVCRYHSLLITQLDQTPLQAVAWTENNELMALVHKSLPIWAVQFHPEAILTNQGLDLIRNWLTCFNLRNNKPLYA